MDKSKNRSDLLAAGRKKLQQFRQKKDGKGSSSHGKSSKKHSKSDQPEAEIDAKNEASQSTASVNAMEVDAGQPRPESAVASQPEADIDAKNVASQSTENAMEVDAGQPLPDSAVNSEVVSLPNESEDQATFKVVTVDPDSISVSLGEGESSAVAQLSAIDRELTAVAKSLAIDDESKRITESPSIDGEPRTVAESPAFDSESKTVAESPTVEGESITIAEPAAIDGGSTTAAELPTVDGESKTAAELSTVDGESTTAAELCTINGESATVAEPSAADGESATVAEPSVVDGESATVTELPASNGDTITVVELPIVEGESIVADASPGINSESAIVTHVPTIDPFGDKSETVLVGVNDPVADISTMSEGQNAGVVLADDASPSASGAVNASQEMAVLGSLGNMNREEDKDPLVSSEQLLDGTSIQLGGAQVTDEADGLGSDHINSSAMSELQGGRPGLTSGIVNAVESVQGDVTEANLSEQVISGDYSSLMDKGADVVMKGRKADEDPGSPDLSLQPLIFEDESHGGPLDTKTGSKSKFTLGSSSNTNTIGLPHLIEVIKGLSIDDFGLLLEARGLVSGADLQRNIKSTVQESISQGELEKLDDDLFLSNLTNEIFYLQLKEHSELQIKFKHQQNLLVDEISRLNSSLAAVCAKNEGLREELLQCRCELQAAVGGQEVLQDQVRTAKVETEALVTKLHELQTSLGISTENLASQALELAASKGSVEALQLQNVELNYAVASLTEEREKIEESREHVVHEIEKLSTQLAENNMLVEGLQTEKLALTESLNMLTEEKGRLAHEVDGISSELGKSKGLVADLQSEVENLNRILIVMAEDGKKTKEEKDHLVYECDRLSEEILLFKRQLSSKDEEHSLLEEELKEKMICLEQLVQENLSLRSTLETCNKTAETESFPRGQRNQLEALDCSGQGKEDVTDSGQIAQTKVCDFSPLKERGSSVFLDKGTSIELPENCSELSVLKGRTDNMLKIFQKLEEAIEGIHSSRTSSSKSGDKVGAAGVSKLIHAFESKISIDEQEGGFMTAEQSLTDQCTFSRELIVNLKALLKQLALDIENAAVLFRRQLEEGRTANILISNLKDHCDSLKEDNDCLEGSTIELEVFCEVLMQCMSDVKLNNCQLLTLNEALNKQDIALRRESNELCTKLRESESRVRDLDGRVQQLQQTFDEWSSLVYSQFQSLQMEVAQGAVMLQLEQSVVISEIAETVEKLNSYISVIPDHNNNGLDINACVCASVFSAIRVIESLQEEVRGTQKDMEEVMTSCRMTEEKLSILQDKNESAIAILASLFIKLRRLVISSHFSLFDADERIKDEEIHDPLEESDFNIIVEELENILGERSKLVSDLNQLQSELRDKMQYINEMNMNCIGIDSIHSLINDVQTAVNPEGAIDMNGQPLLLLQSLISFLVGKYREASEQVEMSREAVISKAMESTNATEALHQSNSSHPESEITILRESLSQAEEKLALVRTQLHEKSTELELSEQRVSSLREKLSIAVSKGKALVVQRDSLKQSLAETSSELEKCLQELQMKEARLHEVETKLRTYSEAGERVEALESELSYIRNSATALRESFLLKDSFLQRIEEILEDLNLPEHFHEKDIIEKVHWLARSVTGNSSPPNEWDQKSSVGGSYSDAGANVTDAWREEVLPSSNSWDDLRRKYDDLQSKFYGLAEQNEMLEQSLMERNNLVQRWEELLGRINVPSHMRSVEPEEKIEWLGNTLLEVHGDKISLQQKIDKIESYCGSLTADLEESCRRVSDLEEELQVLTCEKAQLSEKLELLREEHEELSLKADKFESENEKLQLEAVSLQNKLAEKIENESNIQEIEMGIKRLQDIIGDVLLDSVSEDSYSKGSGIDALEGLLRKLIAKHMATITEKSLVGDATHADDHGTIYASSTASRMSEEPDVTVLKNELEDTFSELTRVKEERNMLLEKNDYLVHEVEAFQRKIEELQGLLNLEEQKSASVREKLNVAVRKGKLLVQHRDNLKQTIEEMNVEVGRLKSDINHKENVLKDYENKVMELSSHSSRVEALESELLLLRNHWTETEQFWQEKGRTLEIILSTIAEINLGVDISYSDPVDKLRQMGKLYVDNNAHMASLEQESKKSKRAAELLLAELNEVQDRNDRLQEEIAQATDELHKLYQEKDIAEAAKHEVISHSEHLSAIYMNERRKIFSELMMLKSAAELLKDVFRDFTSLLGDVLSEDLETLQKLQIAIDSCFIKRNDASDVLASISVSSHCITFSYTENKENIFSVNPVLAEFGDNSTTEACDIVEHCLQEFHTGIGALKEDLHKHFILWQEQTSSLSDVLSNVNGDLIAQKQLLEVLERENSHFKLTEKQKGMEIAALHRNLALLCEAFSSSLVELENSKSSFGRNLSAEDWKMKVDARDQFSSGDQSQFSSEEFVRTVADTLLSSIKEFACIKAGTLQSNERELKSTIANLQNQLQEKDIQKDKICMEFVNQIKAAEAAASRYSSDLESSKDVIRDLEEQVKVMEGEHRMLEQRLNEMQDVQVLSADLQERLRSLTDLLASKDQEIEALMQALDEEEIQMESLAKKTEELEKILQEKNLIIEELEGTRGKTLKKLSITVSKFDELHQFSASLLAEVEKLQAQLTERDAEISFLRQEVTRCTNDALVASHVGNKTKELQDFLAWFDTTISGGVMDGPVGEISGEVDEYKELLQKKIMSIVSEIENLRVAAQQKDTLLQLEKNKVDELKRKEEALEKSLHEKESKLSLLQGMEEAGQTTGSTSEIVEVEPARNSWAMTATSTAPQVRSLRKANNDQVAIAIDMDPASSNRLDDDDDDKVHGFKSLTTSGIVPKFTRPVTDLVDGLWVSCDRALMRQPTLRLGIIIYWAVLHALLATFIV